MADNNTRFPHAHSSDQAAAPSRRKFVQQALSSSAALMLLSAVNPLKLSALPAGTLVSRTFSTPRHTTHYIECGPVDGPLMMFLHGWPELSLMWRAQMDAFAAEGWHCVAPDLRGYGGSSAPRSKRRLYHQGSRRRHGGAP